jgi:hypothetical protein
VIRGFLDSDYAWSWPSSRRCFKAKIIRKDFEPWPRRESRNTRDDREPVNKVGYEKPETENQWTAQQKAKACIMKGTVSDRPLRLTVSCFR